MQAQTLQLNNAAPWLQVNYSVHLGDYIAPGSSGAGQTWDFSQLTSNQTFSYQYADASAYDDAPSFPGANTVQDEGNAFLFYTYSDSGVQFLGTSMPSNNVLMTYQNPQKLLTFPCSLNTAWDDDFGGTWTSSTGTAATTAGTSSAIADAEGSLIMPYGTMDNVLRISLTYDYTDDFSGQDIMQYQVTMESFYKPGISEPLVSTVKEVVMENMVPAFSDSSSSWLSAESAGIPEAMANSIGIDLMPNPARSEVALAFGNGGGNYSIELVDATGKLVKYEQLRTAPGISSHRLDLGGITPGLYLVRIIGTNGEQGVQRLMVE